MAHRFFSQIFALILTLQVLGLGGCVIGGAVVKPVAAEPSFWSTEVMTNESVLMVAPDHGTPEAPLLFRPIRILSVKNSHLNEEYQEGKDYVFQEGRLRLLPGSRAAFLNEKAFTPPHAVPQSTMPKRGGGYLLFDRWRFFHDHQLAVTYTHRPGVWRGPVACYSPDLLPGSIEKLKSGKPFKLVLYGDSISAGYNASGVVHAPPYMACWGELAAQRLREAYSAPIEFKNPSVGGKTSSWGRRNVRGLVSEERPDLVILAFGMNERDLSPASFVDNLKAIMADVKTASPSCEFILVAPMLPNPSWADASNMERFYPALKAIESPGRAVIDMTGVHRELLRHKRYADMTGNNVNHPNDFLSRWYFHMVAALLIPNADRAVGAHAGQ